MEGDNAELLGVLNSSGFPFQVGVRNAIEASSGAHNWLVDAEEFKWRHPTSGKSGFADLVVRHREFLYTIVIECKRVKTKGHWVFLMPSEARERERRLSFSYVGKESSDPTGLGPGVDSSVGYGWFEWQLNPMSPESAYCAFKGQDERNALLERVADDLLPAAEAVGWEEGRHLRAGERRLVMPMIITNAILCICKFDAGSVALDTGQVAENACDFITHTCVRFRKSLHTTSSGYYQPNRQRSEFHNAHLAEQRTILVVSAGAIGATLKDLSQAYQPDVALGFALSTFERMRRISRANQ